MLCRCRFAPYGTFTAVYGFAWLGGSALIGVFYGHSIHAAQTYVLVTQLAALIAFVPLLARPSTERRTA